MSFTAMCGIVLAHFDFPKLSFGELALFQPVFAASHLGLFCFPMSHKKDTRLMWVKVLRKRHTTP